MEKISSEAVGTLESLENKMILEGPELIIDEEFQRIDIDTILIQRRILAA